MVTFTTAQRAYLSESRLGRLATVGADGQPHVVPVGFTFNDATGTIELGGHAVERTKKFRDASAHPQVAFVVDDIVSTSPWQVRGVEIRGRAETFTEGGERLRPGFGAAWIRITPEMIVAWGLNEAG